MRDRGRVRVRVRVRVRDFPAFSFQNRKGFRVHPKTMHSVSTYVVAWWVSWGLKRILTDRRND